MNIPTVCIIKEYKNVCVVLNMDVDKCIFCDSMRNVKNIENDGKHVRHINAAEWYIKRYLLKVDYYGCVL